MLMRVCSYEAMEIDELTAKCGRCEHEWLRRTGRPKQCPKCRSPYWDQPRVRGEGKVDMAEKKSRESSAGVVAQNGVGGAPSLPPMGKSELGDELSPVARSPELMASLQEIAAGNIHANHFAHDPDAEQAEVDLCGERFHSEVDGEWYMCGKEKHPFPKVKHGDWIKV